MAKRRRYSEQPFGSTIEDLMAETGTTYRGLADKAGLSAGYLNHIVHGNRPVPSNDVIARIAESLGYRAAWYLTGATKRRPPYIHGIAMAPALK